MKDIDRYRGCLIGGAAEDTLGYAFESTNKYSGFHLFGEKITEVNI